MPLLRAAAAAPPPPGESACDMDDLVSADADTRRRAASALGQGAVRPGGDEEILAALAARLRDEPDAGVREAMFAAFSAIGGGGAAALLAPLLRLDDAGLRNGALETLKRLGGDAVAALDDLLTDADADVRLFAVEVMRAWPAALATPRLAALLAEEGNVNVAGMALDVAAAVADAAVLPALDACQARFAGDYFIAFAAAIARDALAGRVAAAPAAPRARALGRGKPAPGKQRKAGP